MKTTGNDSTPAMTVQQRSDYIISHIDEAIQRGWLVLYFQPVIRTLSGRICSGEALARWLDPQLGMISPGEFVPVLEKAGLSYKLARFVINEAAAFISTAGRTGMYPIPISINLSRRDFDEFDPFEEIERAVAQYQISRNLLCIEITESTVMEHPEKVKDFLDRFHQAGYEVWMDDFGSAYSSLNVLKDFYFDEIKLDMAFMRHFNDRARKIVASCINMAKDLGIHTLCEGVETREQVDFLLEHGCEKIQGFYYSKPRPIAELKEVIDQGGFSYERSVERFLYDEAGSIKLDPALPNAVLLCQDRNITPLEISQPLREAGARLGLPLVKLHEPLVPETSDLWDKITTVIHNCQASGKKEEVSYFLNGHYYLITAVTAAHSNIGFICTMEVRDITESARGLVLSDAGPVTQSVMKLYDCIYKADLATGELEVVLSDFPGEMAGRRFHLDPESMAAFIFWKDRARFRAWSEPQHIRAVLCTQKKRSMSDLFRLERSDGARVWELFTLLPDADGNADHFILCMKRSIYSDPDMARNVINMLVRDTGSGDYTLLHDAQDSSAGEQSSDPWSAGQFRNAFLEQSTLRIFWKDTDRRFLGVSRSFLEYFGLESADAVLGRTGEECQWHLDDQDDLLREEKVLKTGQDSGWQPGRVIVNGVLRNTMTARFPVYHAGKICGLIGVFTDAADLIPVSGDAAITAPGRNPGLSASIDDATGVMNFAAWSAELAIYEDNYSRVNEDYQVGILVLSNYWRIYHEFGQQTAEHLARVAAETLLAELPEGCVVGRMDKEMLAVISKVPTLDLQKSFGRIASILAKNHYIGTYCGMISTYYSVSARSETNNPIRVVGLALEQAEKNQQALDYRNERSPYGMAVAEESPEDYVVTHEQIQDRIHALLHSFDIVRLVDPMKQQIIRYERGGEVKFQHGNCFDVWGTGVPCDNCISRRTIRTKEKLTKFETDGENLYIVLSQYLEVDGRPCVMEVVTRMNDSSHLGADERGIFIRALANCRARMYEDTETGIHNRRYYEDILTDHSVAAAAVISIDNLEEINHHYGELAGEQVMKHTAQTISSGMPYQDLVRFSGDQFLISFPRAEREEVTEQLTAIVNQIREAHYALYPDLRVSVSAGGICRKGRVGTLLPVIEEALRQAQAADTVSEVVVL